jgi:hypothetical protein
MQKSSPPTSLQTERRVEQLPTYYTGNDEPAAFAVSGQQSQ